MDDRDPYARLVEELGQILVDHIERHHPEASRFAAIKALGAAAKALAMIYGPSIVSAKSGRPLTCSLVMNQRFFRLQVGHELGMALA